MAGTVTAAFIAGEEPYVDNEPGESGVVSRTYLGHGVAHDTYSTMLAGGPGAERHSNILWAGWAFAVLQAVFFVALLAFGMRKKGESGPALIPIVVGGAIFVGIFTMLFFAYRTYMNNADPGLVLALPKPTAWMIYGVWFFPVVFVFIYRYFFSTWYLTDEDMERFRAIMAERQAADEERA